MTNNTLAKIRAQLRVQDYIREEKPTRHLLPAYDLNYSNTVSLAEGTSNGPLKHAVVGWLFSKGICIRTFEVDGIQLIEFATAEAKSQFQEYWFPKRPPSLPDYTVTFSLERALRKEVLEGRYLTQEVEDWLFEENIPHLMRIESDEFGDAEDIIHFIFATAKDATLFKLRWY